VPRFSPPGISRGLGVANSLPALGLAPRQGNHVLPRVFARLHHGGPLRQGLPSLVEVGVPVVDPLHAVDFVVQAAFGNVRLDPEGGQVLEECWHAWRELPHGIRARVQLACLPMIDAEENAIIVNAIQRHAAVVVQKSLAEGFGLTVAEAMFKGRPVIASRVGGIPDQIVDGRNGLLIDDPNDAPAFEVALGRVLDDPAFAEELGSTAREDALAHHIGDVHLGRWAALVEDLLS